MEGMYRAPQWVGGGFIMMRAIYYEVTETHLYAECRYVRGCVSMDGERKSEMMGDRGNRFPLSPISKPIYSVKLLMREAHL